MWDFYRRNHRVEHEKHRGDMSCFAAEVFTAMIGTILLQFFLIRGKKHNSEPMVESVRPGYILLLD